MQLKKGETIALVGNSNPQTDPIEIQQLQLLLKEMGLNVIVSPILFDASPRCAAAKASILMDYFKDSRIKAIFDISGGDRANSLLPFLDFKQLAQYPTPFFGYSDLTTLLNSLFLTGQSTYLFQLKTLLWDSSGKQRKKFQETFFQGKDSLFRVEWQFSQGQRMTGTVIGGNLRCFLKLAGTPYLPNLSGKILFLESFGGNLDAIYSMLNQLTQLPNFKEIEGVLLGTFTRYQEKENYPISQLVKDVFSLKPPIAKTEQIGHSKDSQALILGQRLDLIR